MLSVRAVPWDPRVWMRPLTEPEPGGEPPRRGPRAEDDPAASPLPRALPVALVAAAAAAADQPPPGADPSKYPPQQRYIVETITMTTVTERRIVREADEHVAGGRGGAPGSFRGGAHADAAAVAAAAAAVAGDAKLSGILKGGKLWKSPDGTPPPQHHAPAIGYIEESSTSFSDSGDGGDDPQCNGGYNNRRSVRFSEETNLPPDSPGVDALPLPPAPAPAPDGPGEDASPAEDAGEDNDDASPDATELTLTFKLGNHVLVANSLRPNSAVRQLFPAPRFLSPPPLPGRVITDDPALAASARDGDDGGDAGGADDENERRDAERLRNSRNAERSQQYLVTADSLRLFEEAKRAKMAQLGGNNRELSEQQYIAVMSPLPLVTSPLAAGSGGASDDDDASTSSQIRRTIERNALRRSLLRYEPGRTNRRGGSTSGGGGGGGGGGRGSEDSLVERIKKLTCDIDDEDAASSPADAEGEDGGRRGGGVDASTDTDLTDSEGGASDAMPPRASPPGEERRAAKATGPMSPGGEGGTPPAVAAARAHEKTSSPSSGSSSSTMSSGSASSTYKKLTDLFARRGADSKGAPATIPEGGSPQEHSKPQPPTTIEWATPYYSTECAQHQYISPPDLGNGLPLHVTPPRDFANGGGGGPAGAGPLVGPKAAVCRAGSSSEARKQFLSSLAPLAACVSAGAGDGEDPALDGGAGDAYCPPSAAGASPSAALGDAGGRGTGDRASVASGGGGGGDDSEYSLDDIDEVLKEESKAPQPDVVAGTQAQPVSNEGLANTVDELALFVQRDAGRIERIRKRYGSTSSVGSAGGGAPGDDDDDHDDYGFNRRPSVRGIKPRFGSTTEILQQMQTQLQPPALACAAARGSHVTWPYAPCPEGASSPIDPGGARRRGGPGGPAGPVGPGGRGPMPALHEDPAAAAAAYPYEYARGVGVAAAAAYADYNGLVVHPDPADPMRKEAARRYVSPSQIMYASTGSLYAAAPPQPQLMRVGGDGTLYAAAPPPHPHPHAHAHARPLHAPHHAPPHLQPQHAPAAGSPPPAGTLPRSFAPGPGPQATAPDGTLVPYHPQYAAAAVAAAAAAAAADARFQSLDRAVVYGRRAAPGLVHMRLSPVAPGAPPPQQQGGQQPPYAASVRLSAPFGDPNITAVIEPHYSTLPHPGSSRASPVPGSAAAAAAAAAASVIRVSGGQQQTIRVPYQTGAPVQVHLLARAGVGVGARSDSPQRGLGSPSQAQPYPPPPPASASAAAAGAVSPGYGVARGTQTAGTPLYPAGGGRFYPAPPPNGGSGSPAAPYKGGVPFPDPGKAASAGGGQSPSGGVGVGAGAGAPPGPRRAASPLPYQNISSSSSSTASSSPTRSLKYGGAGGAERGVPEGAASSSPSFPQDSLYHAPTAAANQPLSPSQQSPAATPTAPAAATSVYYAMNV